MGDVGRRSSGVGGPFQKRVPLGRPRYPAADALSLRVLPEGSGGLDFRGLLGVLPPSGRFSRHRPSAQPAPSGSVGCLGYSRAVVASALTLSTQVPSAARRLKGGDGGLDRRSDYWVLSHFSCC